MNPVNLYADYLPHRGPMIWIDYVLSADAEGGVCLVKIDPKKHYFSDTGVRQSAFVEWMAQAYGFVSAEFYKSSGATLEKAFLVGVDRMTFSGVMPKAGEEILVSVKKIRMIGPISYVEGKISARGSGEVFAASTIKLFSA